MFSVKLSSNHYIAPDNADAAVFDVGTKTQVENTIVQAIRYSNQDRLENAIASEVSTEGDVLTFTEDSENILTVTVDGYSYTLGVGTLKPGEFKHLDGQVELKLVAPTSANSIVKFRKGASIVLNKTTDICESVEPVLLKWNVNGSFNIVRGYQQEPAASFSFVACRTEEDRINRELCNGKELLIAGIRWNVSNLNVTIQKNSDQIVVTVALKHFLASRGNPSKSKIDKNLVKKKSLGRNNYRRRRDFSELVAESGVRYRGQDFKIRVPRSTKSDDTFTVRELLQQRAISLHSFVFFSGNGIELRNWYGTKVHVFSSDQIIGDFTYTNGGHGTEVDGIKLHTEFRNLQVNLDFDPDASDRNVGVTQRWSFENCRSLEDLLSPRQDRGFYFEQPDPQTLRNVGLNLDSGGTGKKATQITAFNGTTTFEVTYEGGYAYDSAKVYDVQITSENNFILELDSSINAETHWKQIKTSTTNHIFDTDGYRTSKVEVGQELTRLQQESQKLEAITLLAQAIQSGSESEPDPSLLAQSKAYQFDKTLPINKVTNYTLEAHENHFPDTVKAGDKCEEDYFPPKFISAMHSSSISQMLAPNPKSTKAFTYPLIVTGKNSSDFEQTTITSSVFPFQFETRKSVASSQGEYLKNAIAISTLSEHDGKPGTAPRLNRDIDPTNTNSNNNYDLYKDGNYYISSKNVDDQRRIKEGSKGYPDIDDPFEAAAISRTELAMINSRSSRSAEANFFWREGVEEGDLALIDGRFWRIYGIRDNRDVLNGYMRSRSFNLTLGANLISDIELEDRTGCNDGGVITSSAITPPVNIPITTPVIPIPTPDNFYRFDGNLSDSIS